MGIDLTASFQTPLETTALSWPKCFACSTKLGKLYPVEALELVGRERSPDIGDRFRVVVEVTCHDLVQRLVVASKRWHGDASTWDAIGNTFAFVRDGNGRWTTAPIGPEWRRKKKSVALWRPGAR